MGRERGLRLHRFKRTMGLPRVARVLGVLRSLQPRDLLDIGSGRGVFLWPLIEEFPELEVTALDRLEHRIASLRQVVAGGCPRLTVVSGDCLRLPFADRSFEVVTMLEVLEHIPEAGPALAEVGTSRRALWVESGCSSGEGGEGFHSEGARLFQDCECGGRAKRRHRFRIGKSAAAGDRITSLAWTGQRPCRGNLHRASGRNTLT